MSARGTAFVCRSCTAGQAGLAERLSAATRDLDGLQVSEAECLQNCNAPSTVAFRGAGLAVHVFREVTLDDVDDLASFARSWLAAPQGMIADARHLGALRFKLAALVPALPE